MVGLNNQNTNKRADKTYLSGFLSRGCSCGVVVNIPDCDIVVNEFELQSHYYLHFRINIPGKVRTRLFPLAVG